MTLDDFVASITRTLEKNGYPGKRVALPLDRMYATAYDKGLNFNKALSELEERGVAHEKTEQKVIFFPKQAAAPDLSSMPDMSNMGDMLAQARAMVEGLSPEEQAEFMRKAKEMGLI